MNAQIIYGFLTFISVMLAFIAILLAMIHGKS